jgi:S-adenosylmethionine decarboxylase proenzyme
MPGLHLIADLLGCAPASPMRDEAALAALCRREAAAAGLTVVGELFHPFTHDDGTRAGVTGVLLLAESHVAIHTWPERGLVTLDVYVCNVNDDRSAGAERLLAALREAFVPAHVALHRVRRDTGAGVAASADR